VGSQSASTKPLVSAVEKWADEWANENPNTRAGVVAEKIFEVADWSFRISLFRWSNAARDSRSIAIHSEGARFIGPAQELRDALAAKASRYGRMDCPYIVVVGDCKREMGAKNDRSLFEALFGDPVYQWKENGEAFPGRARNGFWGYPSGLKNINVTAVLLIGNPDLWTIGSKDYEPLLAVNPWAEFALPPGFLPLNRFELKDEHWSFAKGVPLHTVLQLPNTWPPDAD
jgi:hypothetical protein